MFIINVHCIVFGVSTLLNKRCILSLNKDEINFPKFKLETKDIKNINQSIIDFLKQYIFVNDLVLMPQIINLNSPILNNEENALDIVFGFIVDYQSSLNKDLVHWIDFDPMVENKFSTVLFETMQKLS